MDLSIEANKNSALFNTMQQALDVYNPLLHKARPTVVNQTKQRIRCQAAQWGNNFDRWNGRRTARFNLPRIGSLADTTLKMAFRIPGENATATSRSLYGDRGFAKAALTTHGLDNTNSTSNTARGRLDRVYADRLLGLNMIASYVVSSKSREIFRATGEYLLTRFAQMDDTMKEAVFRATTPVDVMAAGCENTFYAPATTYQVQVPLFAFFNEHITNALDVNFSEEVHIDITFRSPTELFYYGNLGDLTQVPLLAADTAATTPGTWQRPALDAYTSLGVNCWDQSTTSGSTYVNHADSVVTSVTIQQAQQVANTSNASTVEFGTANVGTGSTTDAVVFEDVAPFTAQQAMNERQMQHIQGIAAPWQSPARATLADLFTLSVPTTGYYDTVGFVNSSTTFAYPDVDTLGESVSIQLELNCDYVIQDTDAYRALRAETFPAGTGFTSIVYNTAQETFSDLMASTSTSANLLDVRSGGSFTDPDQSASGISVGDSTRYVDLPLRDNHLTFATHFMVRKTSDMGGSRNTTPSKTGPLYGKTVSTSTNLGAHNIYTRALPVHYFQVLAAGRVIYESDGASQMALTQSAMYNGTGKDFATQSSAIANQTTRTVYDTNNLQARPFNIYSINYGLQASRLENTGCISYQNLNNPTLRIYFKPDTWAEHCVAQYTDGGSEAKTAASLGVQVDVIHEHFNVVTINSGNGEITSGLNA